VPPMCPMGVYICDWDDWGRGDPSSENLIKFNSKSLFGVRYIRSSAVIVFKRRLECTILYRYRAIIFPGDFQKYFIFNNRWGDDEGTTAVSGIIYAHCFCPRFNSHNNATFLWIIIIDNINISEYITQKFVRYQIYGNRSTNIFCVSRKNIWKIH